MKLNIKYTLDCKTMLVLYCEIVPVMKLDLKNSTGQQQATWNFDSTLLPTQGMLACNSFLTFNWIPVSMCGASAPRHWQWSCRCYHEERPGVGRPCAAPSRGFWKVRGPHHRAQLSPSATLVVPLWKSPQREHSATWHWGERKTRYEKQPFDAAERKSREDMSRDSPAGHGELPWGETPKLRVLCPTAGCRP